MQGAHMGTWVCAAAWHLHDNESRHTWYQSKLPSDLEYLASQKLRLESACMKMFKHHLRQDTDGVNRSLTLWHVASDVQQARVLLSSPVMPGQRLLIAFLADLF